MSDISTPLSPDAPYDERSPSPPAFQPEASPATSAPLTRTVAIIKHHALEQRLLIEPRIQAANFEIVKERRMEFDIETDPEYMYELFGEDMESLGEGAVWVYVLERRRAVEVWNTLMGDRDPEVARREAPNSLRALYGISLQQNGLMGSPDSQTAELQIASLFASSPPFPTSELPDDRFNTLGSVTSSVLSALQKVAPDEGYAPSTPSGTSGGKLSANGKAAFRARALPSTHAKPDIVPRMSRAASLRAGTVIDKPAAGPRSPPTKDQLAKTFANVPGHKRAQTIQVASTAAPTIAPRMTRAAALRLGQAVPASPVKKRPTAANGEAPKSTFEGVPGHKRRESIAVASVAAPTVKPRLNKSASLRAQKDQAPPTSFMFRAPSAPKTPGLLSRSNSQTSLNSAARPPISRPASQASIKPSSTRPIIPRSSSATPSQPKLNGSGTPSTNGTTTNGAPAKPPLRARPSSISAPSIAPRTNKSAALRLAKKAEEEAAAAAAAKKKLNRTSRIAPRASLMV